MFNKITLIGHTGQDPEARVMQNGTEVSSFRLATSERWKDNKGERQEKTEWHNIVIFGSLAKIARDYVKKGDKIHVEGKVRYRKWTAEDGTHRHITEIICDTLTMLGVAEKNNIDTPPSTEHYEEIPF